MAEINPVMTVTEGAKQTDDNTFKFSYFPLLIDYAIRWIILEVWRYEYIGSFIFWLLQIVLSVTMIAIVGHQTEKAKREKNVPGIFIEETTWSLVFLLCVIFSGSIVTYTLYSHWSIWAKGAFTVGTFFIYGFYCVILYVSSKQRISVAEYRKTHDKLLIDDAEPVDTNDLRIAMMETEISSISHRIESFTLESALFGALAFSGFLTLIASEKFSLANIQDFTTKVDSMTQALRSLDFNGMKETYNLSMTESCLMGSVAVQTLICSMVFVSIMVSRRRFYDVMRTVDFAIRNARMYNDKEEETYTICLEQTHPHERLEKRLRYLTKKVAEATDAAEFSFRDLRFTERLIRGLRNLGISSFVLILLTSAFFVAQNLALIFIVLVIIVLIYKFADDWLRSKKIQKNASLAILERGVSFITGKMENKPPNELPGAKEKDQINRKSE